MDKDKGKASGVPEVMAVPRVRADAVYTPASLRHALGLRPTSLLREIKKKRLRCTHRCGHVYILGAWVIEWLEAGERKRRQHDDAARNEAA